MKYGTPTENKGLKDLIEQDTKVWKEFLERNHTSDRTAAFENNRKELVKRVLYLISQADIQVNQGSKPNDAQDKYATSFFISHGSRIAIPIKRLQQDEQKNYLINWIATGNSKEHAQLDYFSQKQAESGKNVLYTRSAATHGAKFDADGNFLKETKGFSIGAVDFVIHWFKRCVNRLMRRRIFENLGPHYGVDLALNPNNNSVKYDAIDNGHLYLHYQPPSKKREGVILIGVENSAPSSSKHSKLGKSAKESPTGGKKFKDLQKEYSNIKIPSKYNGMIAKNHVSPENIENYNHANTTVEALLTGSVYTDDIKYKRPKKKKIYKIKTHIRKPNNIRKPDNIRKTMRNTKQR